MDPRGGGRRHALEAPHEVPRSAGVVSEGVPLLGRKQVDSAGCPLEGEQRTLDVQPATKTSE